MRRAQVAAFATLIWSGVAAAAPVVVWTSAEVPDDPALAKADRETGGSAHISALELQYPPAPIVDADRAFVLHLEDAVNANVARWTAFDVELPIAADLKLVLADVTVLGEARDTAQLIDTLLFQGAAAVRAFEADTFPTETRAEPYRWTWEGVAYPLPWIEARALAGRVGREIQPNDHIDGGARLDFQRFTAAAEKLPEGTLTVPSGVGEVWVDGVPVPADATELRLRPGTHFLHVVRAGVVAGRSKVWIDPGASVTFPVAVSDAELEAAGVAVSSGSRLKLPDAVVAALGRVEVFHGGPVFLGHADGRRVGLLAWSEGARLVDAQLVTVVLSGEVGGGVVMSSLFAEAAETSEVGAAAHGGLAIELGVSHFATAVGLDVAITPGKSIATANMAGDANVNTSVLPQPWFGLGVHALRPTGRKPTLSVLGHIAWQGPAHLGYGGRILIGVPIDDRHTWFRIGLGATYGPNSLWKLDADPVSMLTGFVRVGVGARL
jgi:hypothetical protein